MKVQTGTKGRFPIRPMTAIPMPRERLVSRRKPNDEGGGSRTRTHQAVTGTTLAQRPLAPLVESPMSVYVGGVGIGIGCGALVLLLLLGVLSV
jgi:hypothetical protein